MAASTSLWHVRASVAMRQARTSRATPRTASRSPREAIGKPASTTYKAGFSSVRASRSFSSTFMEKPGDCSPSRRVVSKMPTLSIGSPSVSTPPRPVIVQFIILVLWIDISYIYAGGVGRMDLAELHVFLTVAREGSFSRAAEKLFRTQPAVSLAINRLEASVGQPLFVRRARPVRLTDEGALLRDYAERLLNLREEAREGLSDLRGLARGELSLDVNDSSIHALLPSLARFRKLHPGVRIAVHRTFSRDIPHEVLNYRLDLGAVSYVPREPQLAATEILRARLTFVVPPVHKLAKRGSVDITELAKETFIAHIVESPFLPRSIAFFPRPPTPLTIT